MTSILPICCAPEAYRLLAAQVAAIASPDALLNGAVAIATHEGDGAETQSADAQIQKFADTIRSRVHGRQPQALLAHLHEHLFDELGFRGNTDDYYNPANSYLPTVLQTRRGLPITLSLVYKLVAERLGLKSWGVGLPGHFLVAVEMDGAPILIDTFNGGRPITEDEAHARLKEMFGNETEWTRELLLPASNRHWLTRILQNLLNVFGSSGRYSDVAAVLEMEILLWPEQSHLQRDLGLVLARCGYTKPATTWLARYLRYHPEDPQKSQIKELLQVLAT